MAGMRRDQIDHGLLMQSFGWPRQNPSKVGLNGCGSTILLHHPASQTQSGYQSPVCFQSRLAPTLQVSIRSLGCLYADRITNVRDDYHRQDQWISAICVELQLYDITDSPLPPFCTKSLDDHCLRIHLLRSEDLLDASIGIGFPCLGLL